MGNQVFFISKENIVLERLAQQFYDLLCNCKKVLEKKYFKRLTSCLILNSSKLMYFLVKRDIISNKYDKR